MNKRIQMLAEGGLCLALALALSYLKIEVGAMGGSIDFVMIPLIVFAWRWGWAWGVGLGFVFGTMKFFLAGGVAINWQSMLLDYSLAYAAVGLAGLLRRWKLALPYGALLGCLARFFIHWLSGVTIYAEYKTELTDFFSAKLSTPTVALFSLVYNAPYMIVNTVIAVAVCALLVGPLQKLKKPEE